MSEKKQHSPLNEGYQPRPNPSQQRVPQSNPTDIRHGYQPNRSNAPPDWKPTLPGKDK